MPLKALTFTTPPVKVAPCTCAVSSAQLAISCMIQVRNSTTQIQLTPTYTNSFEMAL